MAGGANRAAARSVNTNVRLQQKLMDLADKYINENGYQLSDDSTALQSGLNTNLLGAITGGGNIDAYSPVWQAGKLQAERGYGQAMDDLIASGASGGALTSGIAELGSNRADALTNLKGTIWQDMYGKAYDLNQTNMSYKTALLNAILGNSGGGMAVPQQTQSSSAGLGALGQGLGGLFSGLLGSGGIMGLFK